MTTKGGKCRETAHYKSTIQWPGTTHSLQIERKNCVQNTYCFPLRHHKPKITPFFWGSIFQTFARALPENGSAAPPPAPHSRRWRRLTETAFGCSVGRRGLKWEQQRRHPELRTGQLKSHAEQRWSQQLLQHRDARPVAPRVAKHSRRPDFDRRGPRGHQRPAVFHAFRFQRRSSQPSHPRRPDETSRYKEGQYVRIKFTTRKRKFHSNVFRSFYLCFW